VQKTLKLFIPPRSKIAGHIVCVCVKDLCEKDRLITCMSQFVWRVSNNVTVRTLIQMFSVVSWCLFLTDEKEFRNFIVWMEDQKIRHYKIEDRAALRNIKSSDWSKAHENVSTINVYYLNVRSHELFRWPITITIYLNLFELVVNF
jgi:hypothetical protein